MNEYRALPFTPGAPPKQAATAEFRGDSVIAEAQPGGLQRIASRAGALPFLNPSFVLVEQVIRRAVVLGGARVTLPLFVVTGGRTLDCDVVRVGADSVSVMLGGTDMRFAVDAAGGIRGGIIPSQGLTVLRVADLPERLLDVPAPDYSAPAGAPYGAEEVRVTVRDGTVLVGTLTLPRGAQRPVPAVVTITGSGSEDRDENLAIVRGYRPFRQVADTLGRRGIAVLRLDDRGFGSSGGSAAKATSWDFANDIEDAVKWLRARRDVDGRRIALLGHSEGGLIAPLVASRDPKLRGIVLLAGPAYDGRRILAYQQARAVEHAGVTGARRDSLLLAAAQATDSLARQSPWFGWFIAHDPLAIVRGLRQPVLILQGETDRQVTAEQAEVLEQALRAGGNRDVTRRMFAATNHLFVPDADGAPEGYLSLPDGNVRAEVLGALADWLVAHLK